MLRWLRLSHRTRGPNPRLSAVVAHGHLCSRARVLSRRQTPAAIAAQIAAGTYTPPEAPPSKKRNVQSFAEHSHTLLVELLTKRAEPAAQAAVFDVRRVIESPHRISSFSQSSQSIPSNPPIESSHRIIPSNHPIE